VRYEDFVARPRRAMGEICGALELPFSEQFEELFGAFRMTGDSGRGGDVIESRPRRPLDPGLLEQWREGAACRRLAAELGYDEADTLN